MIAPRYSSRVPKRHAGRDALLVASALLAALLAIGGGYALARGVTLPFGLPSLGAKAKPTPIPTLTSLQAIAQIESIYPAAQVSLSSPLLQETDLVTTNGSVQALTSVQATQVLEIYLRGFQQQSQWRWIDHQTKIGVTVTYEVQAAMLWVVLGIGKPCSYTANIFSLTPSQIILRGVTGKSYSDSDVASQPGSGTPPAGSENC